MFWSNRIGQVKGQIVDAEVKQQSLHRLDKQWNIPQRFTIATGDGANDIPMLQAAGKGAAFHAKPKVKAVANIGITYSGLDSLLYLGGWHNDEIDLMLKNR